MEELNQPHPAADKEELNWAMLCHLSALCAYIGIPFGHILGPIIIWQLKKNDYPMVDEHGKESLNFQISITIYAIVSGILIFAIIGFILLPALMIFHLALTIIAAVKTSEGKPYRYPFTIRFLK